MRYDPRSVDRIMPSNGLYQQLHTPRPAPQIFTAPLTKQLPRLPTSRADTYLRKILQREAVNTSTTSPLRRVRTTLWPVLWTWANGNLLRVEPSGSFSKGTANASGTDIDLFISVSPDVVEPLREIYNKLGRALQFAGYTIRCQNVSINVTVEDWSVDLVPAKRQNSVFEDHSLYRRKADTWTKTNVSTHARYVLWSGRTEEIRILKLWRDQLGLHWPSFYLELVVINALHFAPYGELAENVSRVFEFLRDNFLRARFVDPSNSNNIISDDPTATEKRRVQTAGGRARATQYWQDIVV